MMAHFEVVLSTVNAFGSKSIIAYEPLSTCRRRGRPKPGLRLANFLKRQDRRFLIVESADSVGARGGRWDSLVCSRLDVRQPSWAHLSRRSGRLPDSG